MGDRILYESCPLCGAAEHAQLLVADCSGHPSYREPLSKRMVWRQCGACGHIFTEGYYTEEALRLVFATTQKNQRLGDGLEQNRAISARMIDRVLPYRDGGIWLDVGFGNGSLLFTAQEYGFTPLGLDLREENVTALAGLGIEGHCQDICDFRPAEPPAVISMADVLEHTPYPGRILEAAKRLLLPGGVLFLSMPNADAFIWKVASRQNRNPYWAEMEHYHNFSRQRLYALLREHGFAPKRYAVSERYRMCMEVVALSEPATDPAA